MEDSVHLSGEPNTRSKIGLGGLQVLSGLAIYSYKDSMKSLSHHGKSLISLLNQKSELLKVSTHAEKCPNILFIFLALDSI